MVERLLGREASYLRRLGALVALMCGCAAALGLGLSVAAPEAALVPATALSAALAAGGVVLARRS